MPEQIMVLKIFKSWDGRNDKAAWVNNYHILTAVPLEDPKWITLVDQVAGAEKEIHLNRVNFLRAVISTYNVEAQYDFRSLRTMGLSGNGNRSPEQLYPLPPGFTFDVAADLNYALQLNKNATLGRAGKNFYRGALVAPDIIQDGNGEPALTTGGAARFQGGDMANFNGHFNGQAPDFKFCIAPSKGELIAEDPEAPDPEPDTFSVDLRLITGYSLGGVVLLKRNHKFYNQKPKATVPNGG